MILSDALAEDLRDLFLLAAPIIINPQNVRLQVATGELPSPRVVILPAQPKTFYGMNATEQVSVALEYITSLDRIPFDDHRVAAAAIATWWRALGVERFRQLLATRVFLHRMLRPQSKVLIRTEDRETVTSISAEFVVTLAGVAVF